MVAFVIVLGATTWARDGFWSPYGGYDWIVIAVFVVWTLAASTLLNRAAPAPPAAPPRSAPPPTA